MQILRDYQEAAVHAVFDAIEMGYNRILYVQATGTGKTTCFAELTRLFTEYHGFKVLVLVHRIELLEQAYQRIKDHCGFDEWQIGCEIGQYSAGTTCQVIVGSVQTVKGANRLSDFKPDVIITDECHHSSAASYRKCYTRWGVDEGKCLHIGCTATAKRSDKASLYAIKPDGSPVMLYDKKKKTTFAAEPQNSVFEFLCYEYSILNAIEEGYLVPIKGHSVLTDVDLSDVKIGTDGDFQEGELAKAVDNAKRTLQAIAAWKEVATERPTLVFCASVEHAHHAADLWRQAGYTAEAVDGETPSNIRHDLFRDFKSGKLQILCNMGIATEGTDLPNCSCIVHLRPTKSWSLFVQMSGRGSRVLPCVIDGILDPARRVEAIAASEKQDCVIIDLVDLYENNDLCATPSLLDLPASLDLQGESLTATKKMLDEFEEVRDRVIGECPTTYQELKVRLETVNLLRGSGAKMQEDWKATEKGYRCVRVPVGYQSELIQQGEQWQLIVRNAGQELVRKSARPQSSIKALIDHASRWTGKVIEEHRASLPGKVYDTVTYLQEKGAGGLYRTMRARGYSDRAINEIPPAKAYNMARAFVQEWQAKKEKEQHNIF